MSIDAIFTRFPSLTTQRLHLRPLRATDAPAIFVLKSDLEMTRHYGREPHQSLDETETWIAHLQALSAGREGLSWALTLKGEETLIGIPLLFHFDPTARCAEVGYELHPAYQGQGLMREAISAVLACGFATAGLQRIEALVQEENMPSRHLLERLGFTLEGTLRRRVCFRDHFSDLLYFGLLKDEWLPSV